MYRYFYIWCSLLWKKTQRPYIWELIDLLRECGGFDILACQRELLFLGSRGHDIGPAVFCGVQGRSPWTLFEMVYSKRLHIFEFLSILAMSNWIKNVQILDMISLILIRWVEIIILLGSFFSQSGEYEVYPRRYSSYSKKCGGGGGGEAYIYRSYAYQVYSNS